MLGALNHQALVYVFELNLRHLSAETINFKSQPECSHGASSHSCHLSAVFPNKSKMAVYEGGGVVDTFLHYGLFLGAIFQLVCIFAVVVIPQREDDKVSCFEHSGETGSHRRSISVCLDRRTHENRF